MQLLLIGLSGKEQLLHQHAHIQRHTQNTEPPTDGIMRVRSIHMENEKKVVMRSEEEDWGTVEREL